MEYARTLVNLPVSAQAAMHTGLWDPYGLCEVPTIEVGRLPLLLLPRLISQPGSLNHPFVRQRRGS